MKKLIGLLLIPALISCGGNKEKGDSYSGETAKDEKQPEETHFANIKQLTFGGNNAEAYWSFDNSKLVFQSDYSNWGLECDQIFMMPIDQDLSDTNTIPQLISTGKGRTTCSYFMPGNKSIIYASTHLADDACPPTPKRRADGKYVWPIYESFDIFTADMDGNLLKQLTDTPGYDAEATLNPAGDKIVFTSLRTGDLELFTCNIDGSEVTQITDELGYDGGAFFSPDGTKIIFRSSRPKTEEEIKAIQANVKATVADCVDFAEKSPWPEDSELYKDIYVQEDYPFITD